jgi:integrase
MPKERGFGTTRKLPSGNWQAYYTWNGDVFKAPHTFRNKTQATNWIAMEEVKRLNGTWAPTTTPSKQGFTFEDYADNFVENRQTQGRPIRPSTKSLYRKYLATKFGSFQGVDIRSISKSQVEDWYTLETINGKITSTRNAYKLLKAMMAELVANGDRTDNPCQKKGMTKASTGVKRYKPTMDQVRDVSSKIDSEYRFMTDFMAFGGLRFGEAAGLKRRDFVKVTTPKGAKYQVTINGQIQYFDKSFHAGPPKSDAGNRTVQLPVKMTNEVDAHLAKVPKKPQSLVFHDGKGGPLRNDVYAKRLKKAVAAAGLDGLNFTPHSLRHAGATAVSQKGSIAEVQAFLGDSSPAAALRYMDGNARLGQIADMIFVEAVEPPVEDETDTQTA